MSSNVFANYSGDSVFRDRYTLTPEFVPPEMPCREEETNRMVEALSILLDPYRSVAVNFAIIGEAGVGKTTLAKLITGHLQEYALQQNIHLEVQYINCHSFRTKTAILRKLANEKFAMHGRGFSDEELMEMLATRLDRENKRLVLIIDEAGMLKAEDILGLIHINELFGQGSGRMSTIAITRISDWMTMLDSHLSGRIQDKLELENYSREQIEAILRYRRKLGFFHDAFPDDVLNLVIDASASSGNARHGIEIMLRAGMIANTRRAKQVIPEFIRAARNEIYAELRPDIFLDLKFNELASAIAVGRILSKKGAASYTTINESFEVFKLVCDENKIKPPGIATYRNCIKELSKLGILVYKVKSVGANTRGRHSIIGLMDIPAVILIERVQEVMRNYQLKSPSNSST